MEICNFAIILISFLLQRVIDANLNAFFQIFDSLFQFLLLTLDEGHSSQNLYFHFYLVFLPFMLGSHLLHLHLL